MNLTRASFSLAFIALITMPALAESSKWGAIAVDVAVAEREPYYGVGGGDAEQ